MIAQIFLLCFISLAASRPYDVPSYPSPAYEPNYEARPEPYTFGFDTQDEYGRVLRRQEQGDELGNKKGSYGYVDPYGIYRQVEYIADENGFRAIIKTNEPGTESQNPANTEILSEAVPVAHDAVPSYGRAPLSAAHARPTPVVAPSYARPAVAVAGPPAHLSAVAPAAALSPLHGSPIAGVYTQSPAYAPEVYASSPAAYAPVPSAYAPVPSAYAPVPSAYAPAPAAYAPVSGAYAPVSAAYASVAGDYGPARVQEPLSPQSYAGPSYEQLSDRANQSNESRSHSE